MAALAEFSRSSIGRIVVLLCYLIWSWHHFHNIWDHHSWTAMITLYLYHLSPIPGSQRRRRTMPGPNFHSSLVTPFQCMELKERQKQRPFAIWEVCLLISISMTWFLYITLSSRSGELVCRIGIRSIVTREKNPGFGSGSYAKFRQTCQHWKVCIV